MQTLRIHYAMITQSLRARLRSNYAFIMQLLRKDYTEITQMLPSQRLLKTITQTLRNSITHDYAIELRNSITQLITQLNYAINLRRNPRARNFWYYAEILQNYAMLGNLLMRPPARRRRRTAANLKRRSPPRPDWAGDSEALPGLGEPSHWQLRLGQ